MVILVEVRVYTHELDERENHLYVVGSSLGGLTDVLGRFQVDETTATFRSVRQKLELGDSKGGERRSMLYREILLECERSSNPHGWATSIKRSSFRLAFLPPPHQPSEGEAIEQATERTKIQPQVVPLEMEGEINLVSFLRANGRKATNMQVVELVVVPVSQVGPGCDHCCRGCSTCSEAKLPDSTIQTSFFQDGRVQRLLANRIAKPFS